MKPPIEPPTPPGQAWDLYSDPISPPSVSFSQGSYHYTKRLVEDEVPILLPFASFPLRQTQRRTYIARAFRKQGSMSFETLFNGWRQQLRRLRSQYDPSTGQPRALMLKKRGKKPDLTLETVLLLKCAIAYLRQTAFLSTDAQHEPLVWLMKNEILLERIYERLRFLYYRLAVYAIACFWSYSEFPGHIRPPCTTMPWTIWPALIVLWGVCWMFYPTSGRAPGAGESETQSHLHHQPQPEDLDGESLN